MTRGAPPAGAREGRRPFREDRHAQTFPSFGSERVGDGQYEIDYDFCKGCGLRVAECPCGSIEMEPEPA